MKQSKKLFLMLCMLVIAFITGCKANEDDKGSSEVPTMTVTPASGKDEGAEGASETKAAYPVTVTGTDGQLVTVEAEPMRIISIGPGITELIFSLGISDKLVGRTDNCDYPAGAAEIESIGGLYTPDYEKIIELEPDLVFTSTNYDADSHKLLTDLGIAVIYLYEDRSFEGVYTMLETIGAACNVRDRAESAILEMQLVIDDIKEKTQGLDPVRVYYVAGYGEGGDFTAGGDTYIHDLVTLAGAINVAADVSGWSYSFESLLEADPDVIVVGNYAYDEFISMEPYKTLNAVISGNVYAIDNNMLDRQTVRNAEAIKELAVLFYPEAFQ